MTRTDLLTKLCRWSPDTQTCVWRTSKTSLKTRLQFENYFYN